MLWLACLQMVENVEFRPIETLTDASTRYQKRRLSSVRGSARDDDDQSLALWRSIDQLVSFLVSARQHDPRRPRAAHARSWCAEHRRAPRATGRGGRARDSARRLRQAANHELPALKNPNAPELPLNAVRHLWPTLLAREPCAARGDRGSHPERRLPTGNNVAFSTFGNDLRSHLFAPPT